MTSSREAAHEAMHDLWGVATDRLNAPDVANTGRRITGREVETEGGVLIRSLIGSISLTAEFDRADGGEEIIEVTFPDDIRDMSETDVRIDWTKDGRQGTNTPPMSQFGQIAAQLKPLIT